MWATAIILNNWTLSYTVRCTLLCIEPLYLRRKSIALAFAINTSKSAKHSDFFKKKTTAYNTRQAGVFYDQFKVRSSRFKNSPLVSLTNDLNEHIKNKTRSA